MKPHLIESLIQKTLQAKRLEEVLETDNIDRSYRKFVRLLHPDVCHLKGATEALAHLNQLKANYLKGRSIEDDAGEVVLHDKEVIFKGNDRLNKLSIQHYRQLYNSADAATLHFRSYLPLSMSREEDCLHAKFKHRSVSLAGQQLPSQHVRWILSRLLEFCAWLSQAGYVHAGIQPESVWIVPKTHGIVVGSFYHMCPIGFSQQTVSASYRHWYPEVMFNHKRAEPYVDVELCKRLACYLLGSKAGNATALHGKCHPAFINFLSSTHRDTYQCYDDYRKMLRNNFEKQFYELSI